MTERSLSHVPSADEEPGVTLDLRGTPEKISYRLPQRTPSKSHRTSNTECQGRLRKSQGIGAQRSAASELHVASSFPAIGDTPEPTSLPSSGLHKRGAC